MVNNKRHATRGIRFFSVGKYKMVHMSKVYNYRNESKIHISFLLDVMVILIVNRTPCQYLTVKRGE